MPLVVERCLGLSEKLRKYGPSREIEVNKFSSHHCTMQKAELQFALILLCQLHSSMHITPCFIHIDLEV